MWHGALLSVWQRAAGVSTEHHSEDKHVKWSSKGLGGAKHTFFILLFTTEKVWFKTFLGASLVRIGHFSCPWCGVTFDGLIYLGGDPVITESAVLSMEEDVRVILEDSGLLPFFKKFTGHSEAITKQFVESWKNDRVTINGLDIDVNEGLIAEVTGLPNDGELVSRDKMDQSLPQPWDRVAIQAGKTKSLRHQGLMKFIVEHNSKRHGSPSGPSRGAANKVSGVPITKSQLLIGPAPPSLHLTSVDSESDADDDSESQGMVSPITIPKEKEDKKRKLSNNLAKRRRRSTRLQRKSVGKSNVIVDAGSLEEEQKTDTAQGKVGRSSPSKSAVANPSEKGEGSPNDSQHPSEDLLEIINYLKETTKGKKD
eukprot:Gb_24384 [translate_table: standard]